MNDVKEKREEIKFNIDDDDIDSIKDFTNILLNAEENNAIKEVDENKEKESKEIDLEEFVARNKWQVYRDLVDLFKSRTENDNNLKKQYSKILVWILIIQLVAMNIIFILKGCNKLNFTDTTFNLFITATIAEVFTLVTIIVKYLFTDKLTDLLSGILSDEDKKNKKD